MFEDVGVVEDVEGALENMLDIHRHRDTEDARLFYEIQSLHAEENGHGDSFDEVFLYSANVAVAYDETGDVEQAHRLADPEARPLIRLFFEAMIKQGRN